jgi:hypothetical protein
MTINPDNKRKPPKNIRKRDRQPKTVWTEPKALRKAGRGKSASNQSKKKRSPQTKDHKIERKEHNSILSIKHLSLPQ